MSHVTICLIVGLCIYLAVALFIVRSYMAEFFEGHPDITQVGEDESQEFGIALALGTLWPVWMICLAVIVTLDRICKWLYFLLLLGVRKRR